MDIKSYFSGKDNLQSVIIDELDKAQKNIFVAVAWFTNKRLFNKLLEKQKQGVLVELVTANHEINDTYGNDFDLINQLGGCFLKVGDDHNLMHNKFCIIDYQKVINGSYNWTNKANNSNNENISIVSGNTNYVNDFINEFESLKAIAGAKSESSGIVEVSRILKIFKLYKAFCTINEPQNINPYLHEIKGFKPIENIIKSILEGEYQSALTEIEEFERLNSQIINVSAAEKAFILFQIKLLSKQIEISVFEKSDLESLIDRFNQLYILRINPILLKVLDLKKKIFEKLKKYGFKDNPYKKAEEDFKKAQEDFEYTVKNEIPDLSNEDSNDLKGMYREAVKLCHPDSGQCIFDDKKQAAEIFDALTKAYKNNSLEDVRRIYHELKNQDPNTIRSEFDELEYLRAKLATLKSKLNNLLSDIFHIKSTEVYSIIEENQDWELYFNQQKELLEIEFNKLYEKYVTNEQYSKNKA